LKSFVSLGVQTGQESKEEVMRYYDYYESEIEEKSPDHKSGNENIELCAKDFHAESYRFGDEINVCDDGRSG
jgi:hypothetical protein